MERTELDREALSLLIEIGGTVEQRILEIAMSAAAGRRDPKHALRIQMSDVVDSLQSVLRNDQLLRELLGQIVDQVRPSKQAA